MIFGDKWEKLPNKLEQFTMTPEKSQAISWIMEQRQKLKIDPLGLCRVHKNSYRRQLIINALALEEEGVYSDEDVYVLQMFLQGNGRIFADWAKKNNAKVHERGPGQRYFEIFWEAIANDKDGTKQKCELLLGLAYPPQDKGKGDGKGKGGGAIEASKPISAPLAGKLDELKAKLADMKASGVVVALAKAPSAAAASSATATATAANGKKK